MSRQTTIAIILIIIFFAFGFGAGFQIANKKNAAANIKPDNDTYQAGWNAAKARLNQSLMGMAIPAGAEINNVNGIIQKIDGNKITVKINPLEPLADPDLDIRIITIDANTKINLTVQKNEAQFQKEMQEFQDMLMKNQNNSTQAPVPIMPPISTDPTQAPITPPMSFEIKNINSSELEVNQQVLITSSENIKDKKEFTAIQIDAQENSVTIPGNSPVPPITR